MKKLGVLLLVLGSCQPIAFHDYDDIPITSFIDWKSVLSFEGSYHVYIFARSCSYCESIKRPILKYYQKHHLDFYFLEYQFDIPLTPDPASVIKADSVERLAIKGVPTLFRIDKRIIDDVFWGRDMISDYLHLNEK